MSAYQLRCGDNACYGPAFGPVIADEQCEVSSDKGVHLLLVLRQPLRVDEQIIHLLAVRPRYVGDTLDTIRKSGAIVGVWRVLLEGETTVRSGITKSNAEYWAIGSCIPV